jgi:hypothetical protein
MHPLRQLRESGDNSPAAVAKLLAENVVFHSPLLVREVEGREKVAVIMATSPKDPPRQLPRSTVWMTATRSSAGTAKLRAMRSRALEVVTDNDQGLVVEYTIAFRPLPAIQVFRHVRYPLVKDILGPEYWEYSASTV